MLLESCGSALAAVKFCDQGCAGTTEISSEPQMIGLCYEGAGAFGGPVFVLPVEALCSSLGRMVIMLYMWYHLNRG